MRSIMDLKHNMHFCPHVNIYASKHIMFFSFACMNSYADKIKQTDYQFVVGKKFHQCAVTKDIVLGKNPGRGRVDIWKGTWEGGQSCFLVGLDQTTFHLILGEA